MKGRINSKARRMVHHDFTQATPDPDIDRLGDFFTSRMPEGECRFETFVERPDWAWAIYGRSGQSFNKALLAG